MGVASNQIPPFRYFPIFNFIKILVVAPTFDPLQANNATISDGLDSSRSIPIQPLKYIPKYTYFPAIEY